MRCSWPCPLWQLEQSTKSSQTVHLKPSANNDDGDNYVYDNTKHFMVIMFVPKNMVHNNIKNWGPDDDDHGDYYDCGVLQTL